MDSAKTACCAPGHASVSPASPASSLPDGGFARVATGSTEGMRLLPGGVFLMGNERDYGFPSDGEGPVHEVKLDPFWIDATTVTNRQFCDFVDATGYRTEAERFGWSFVFYGHLSGKQLASALRLTVAGSEWWCRVEGATWRHPEGPGSHIRKRWQHPVVQVSWNDAVAYASWAGKRLPTEAEWEYAARSGLPHANRFPWGDELEPGGRHMMNVWQGDFPVRNTEADGYYGVAPARSFRASAWGLYNMTGNVWEWCHDRFSGTWYARSPAENPAGPTSGERRSMRGGSYLCHASYCNRYRVDARNSNTPDSATTNLGFRCVRDVA
ncbi:Sulfatase-modifying factor 1 [Opitutaceae bacterium TAV5]|nr:Sulfatase-modifying factor 1 [Opitutaceae bacterium TAV5]